MNRERAGEGGWCEGESADGVPKEALAKLQARFSRAREMIRVGRGWIGWVAGRRWDATEGNAGVPVETDSHAAGRARLIHDRPRQAEPRGAVVSVVQGIRRYGEGP